MKISLNNLLFTFLLLTSLLSSSTSKPFKCTTSPATCTALIDYKTKNTTNLSSIKTLFSIKNLRTLLAANNLDFKTPKNQTIQAETTIKIPFTCICQNGTGISNKRPVYTVQPGDGLDHIARDIFSELVTYQEIAAVNNITDVDLIEVGQNLTIPLPCSCDDVNGEKVVHYGHVVQTGSTLESIAADFGTTASILSSLNNGVNDTSLLANQVLDVPLRACNSSVSPSSSDYPLLVPNGTYVFTANSCVKCKCNSVNNWTLQCEPSGLTPSYTIWNTCPSMQCAADNLFLGNTTTTGCNATTCAYSGFNNQTIMTTLASLSTCPGSGNYASSISLSWKFIFISLQLVMLFVYPL